MSEPEERQRPRADTRGEAVDIGVGAVRSLSPTDVSQFIRLDQCRRYLRLRLHEHTAGRRFLRQSGVAPQAIPPLLSRSGADFEARVEDAVSGSFATTNLAPERAIAGTLDNNDIVISAARDVPPGGVRVLLQPRLAVDLAGWRVSGDADLLRVARDDHGHLSVLIVDVKSSTSVKVEHRLQVAFYHEMIAALLTEHEVPFSRIETGILYRAALDRLVTPEVERREAEERAAHELLGVSDALLELVDDPESYRESVRGLVTDRDSVARRVADAPFAEIPFHLTYKCDGCLYTEFCMKWAAERDDLSLLPFLREPEKSALHAVSIATVTDVARLKQPVLDPATGAPDPRRLEPAPGREEMVRTLGATWPIGPRLDELVHRARRYRAYKGERIPIAYSIPNRGHGSLPFSSDEHNPNLVRVFLDAQHDYLTDRLYLLGSLVVGAEHGKTSPDRRRRIVRLAEGSSIGASGERDLFREWVAATLRAIVDVAAADETGAARAPIHLVFYDRYEQRVLLDGLGRHANDVLGATPLFDFMTQLAAFDSPVATFLDEEIRDRKNYPMVCQSLQAVAAFLKFDWSAGPAPFRQLFHDRLFDFWDRLDRTGEPVAGESPWFTSRARFGSQIPLEYAYAAWDELPPPPASGPDLYQGYRQSTPELLMAFQGRRLEAIEHIAADFAGNRDTLKTSFDLPTLDAFEDRARSLAAALDEFVIIERHVGLAAWKRARLPTPERRVVAGETLIGRYVERDQLPAVAAMMRDNERRRQLHEEQRAAYCEEHPVATRIRLTKEQREESEWLPRHVGMSVRLRIEMAGVDADLDQVANLTKFKVGDRVVVRPRWHFDRRLPTAEQVPLQPSAKQLLYGGRATFEGFAFDHRSVGQAKRGWIELTLLGEGPSDKRGFAFRAHPTPLEPDLVYTLDPDPNDLSGMTQATVTLGLKEGGQSPLLDRLTGEERPVASSATAATGQARFLAGLDALRDAGLLHDFEPAKRSFIAEYGESPTLLIQGPPGTGKSYTTAFALLARLQGAMAADLDERIGLSCKTHAAVDVLLANVLAAREELTRLVRIRSEAASFFDPRLFTLPLLRLRPRGDVAAGIIPVAAQDDLPKGAPKMSQRLLADRWAVCAGTPGAFYRLVKEHGGKEIFGHALIDTLVLDEASQMNLPEAAMASLALKPSGRLIVVGDHRQMPPIVQHDWEHEVRRSFQEYRTYESLFSSLIRLDPPTIRFAESFRLHTDMAEFLRREIYVHDGIDFHSRRTETLTPAPESDPFVAAALDPRYSMVVIVHDEAASQVRNPFEQALVTPILEALAERGLDPGEGLGVVVPHRAQRAALQQAVPAVTSRDPETGAILLSAVDTVERFQGDERKVIVVSATESDPGYLLLSAGFLLDPRRLTVALSRAKQKMILVAARSVFDLFSPDEETFRNAQLWKNLLRRTCTIPLWRGDRDGVQVTVWGNALPASLPAAAGNGST